MVWSTNGGPIRKNRAADFYALVPFQASIDASG